MIESDFQKKKFLYFTIFLVLFDDKIFQFAKQLEV